MVMLRLLHLADVHLDTPFYGQEESMRRRLREAARQAFGAAVDAAIDREVHAVLIAGDLFDNDLLSFTTERFLLEQLRRLDERRIPVIYATGNHDPGRANYRAANLDWPANVHCCTSKQPTTTTLHDRNGNEIGRVTAAGHSSAREGDNLVARFPKATDELPHVGLVHAQVEAATGAAAHDRYAPCTPADLAAGGYDYWALGHIHVRGRAADQAPAWYPGNVQGRNPRETGPKGALYVELAKGIEPVPEFVALSPITWQHLQVTCPPSAQTLDKLAPAIVAEIEPQLVEGADSFLRIELTGQSPLASELRSEENRRTLAEELKAAVGAGWLEIRADHVVQAVDVERFRGTPTALGELLDVLSEIGHDDALLDAVAPDPLAQEIADPRAYLRSLLDGLDAEAADALVPEDQR